jgi:hypothetical protein
MTKPSRTTETINRDNAGIRDIMHQVRELTVPDRATLALGLVGHLAATMNRSQMTKLMGELQEEAERVQDVPPVRERERAVRTKPHGDALRTKTRDDSPRDDGPGTTARVAAAGARAGDTRDHRDEGVGQAGRGAFRAQRLL